MFPFPILLPLVVPAQGQAVLPCSTPPSGMVCIEGGPAIVGSDTGPLNERPRRSLFIATFYLDQNEVTNRQYGDCVQRGACRPLSHQDSPMYHPTLAPDKPAVPVDWFRAHEYCLWAGKRLPTEWEWEKAARGPDGDRYPWGDKQPTCQLAVFRECAPPNCKPYPGKQDPWDCLEHSTKAVGSFAPGHYGLFDMAGNGYEWTATWAGNSPRCGQECRGPNPLGPCDGAYPCPGFAKKVLRGGSWYWSWQRLHGSHRRKQEPQSGGHRLSFRCAASSAGLTRFPPELLTRHRRPPALPTRPLPEQLKAFTQIRQDPVLQKPLCPKKGRAFADCRDPMHYVQSNEPRQHVFAPYIKNLGGGYLGIGIDQNYSFIAQARSHWAWIVDYDPSIIHLHLAMRAFHLSAKDRDAFVDLFSMTRQKQAVQVLQQEYAAHPDRNQIRAAYRTHRKVIHAYYRKQLDPKRWDGRSAWLRTPGHYQYIRLLYQQGRIALLKGDLTGDKTLQDIAAAAESLGVPIRVFYPSNAPEFWPLRGRYRDNVLALPFDESSVVLQTSTANKRRLSPKHRWHYNVQSGLHLQSRLRLRGYATLRHVLFDHVITDQPDLSILGLVSE